MRPVLLAFGPFKLYGYGAMLVVAGLAAFWFLHRRLKKAGLNDEDDFWILINVILLSGFGGGRLLYLVEYTAWFSRDFFRTMVSPSSGFSVLGGFISVPIGVWLFCRWRKVPFLRLMDTICVMAPLGHSFSRIGCLLAGCCEGRPTDVPWAIVFRDPRSMVPLEWLGVPLHPAQLYEAFGNALIAAAMYRLLLRTEKSRPGLVVAAYFACYGVERFFLEYYRGDTVPLGWGLTAGQGLGLGLIAASLSLLAWRSLCTRPS
ncbi:MAG: prolipoprotein diacylglyceryl transferase [Elusimicrobia bacterium]|nr:prolipoprotein diacylglyceryl transferase [Elusimicrobiota bacterium]